MKQETGKRQIVARFQIPGTPFAVGQPPGSGSGNHSRVVGIESRGSYADPGPSRQSVPQRGDQGLIAGHAAADHREVITRRLERMRRLGCQYFHRGILEAAGKIRGRSARRWNGRPAAPRAAPQS